MVNALFLLQPIRFIRNFPIFVGQFLRLAAMGDVTAQGQVAAGSRQDVGSYTYLLHCYFGECIGATTGIPNKLTMSYYTYIAI